MDPDVVLERLAAGDHAGAIAHRETLPAREPGPAPALDLPPEITVRLKRAGVERLWSHQAEGLRAFRAGRNVAVATGTASGKSLVYQLATFETLLSDPSATAIYLFPTKALAQDQLRQIRSYAFPPARAAVYDGDTPSSERAWIKRNANLVITNPDMLHLGVLPQHERWGTFLKNLRLIVVDETHTFRGVFGSHVANVLRRLRRLAARYGGEPRFITASATIGNPAELAERLTGMPFTAITEDGSPRGEKVFVFWNPPFVDEEQTVRHSSIAEAAALLAGLVREEVRTIAFARSRKAAEVIAQNARDLVSELPEGAATIAAYRAGYLAEERRELESALVDGTLHGVAATSALELGIDIGGLDACILAGYPGTIASTWQQAGRAGRARQRSLAVLIAQDDPLDQYIVSHPREIFGKPHEAAVIDPANPHILDAHAGCAAYELPLTAADETFFGDALAGAVDRLTTAGSLRQRGERMHWHGRSSPAPDVDIRSAGQTVHIVETDTGRLLGTGDESRARHTLHPGAVYLHQGEQFLVGSLDLSSGAALVKASDVPYFTQARDITDIRILSTDREAPAGRATLFFGDVEVSNDVVGYVRKRVGTNEILDTIPLDLPKASLRTKAVWYTVDDAVLLDAGLDALSTPGAAHAAEHCAIGIMPLFAMCDRWDIGGVSTAMHEDTGTCTVFIYDGYPGGAGFAERSFDAGADHMAATLETISVCACEHGCPSCVQSPKCGNGNEPLDKLGAARMLATILGRKMLRPVPKAGGARRDRERDAR